MDLQLLIVLALVALAAAFLAWRVFGSFASNAKSPGCSGCALSSSCAARTECVENESRQSTVNSLPLRNG